LPAQREPYHARVTLDSIVRTARRCSRPYRVTDGARFRLKDFDPDDTGELGSQDKPRAMAAFSAGIEALSALQERLYAQDRWAVLLIFQALDAAGKDGAIKHVMSGVNPQGCQVSAFKAPSNEELDHDYLWRCVERLPERGRIGIFNRSYYEETLVVRVHPELLARQKLPPALVGRSIWHDRHRQIRHFERYLHENGVIVRKFFLHVSRAEQKRRFLGRIDKPAKHWKFEAGDVAERAHFAAYQRAYQHAIRATATPQSPWYVVPADNKWFTRVVVAGAVIDALASLDLRLPRPSPERRRELARAKAALLSERE
jgi:PPK2 family polyphosphate:nucleotide phosphotransferase